MQNCHFGELRGLRSEPLKQTKWSTTRKCLCPKTFVTVLMLENTYFSVLCLENKVSHKLCRSAISLGLSIFLNEINAIRCYLTPIFQSWVIKKNSIVRMKSNAYFVLIISFLNKDKNSLSYGRHLFDLDLELS